MAQQISEIKAFARKRAGTGGARAVRREAQVPAIIYGEGKTPEQVAAMLKYIKRLKGYENEKLRAVSRVSMHHRDERVRQLRR